MAGQAAQPERVRAWDGVVRREIDVELRVIDDATRTFEVIASTETLDSHGDIVKAHWDLSRYEKNGAVLWNHNLALYMGGDAEDTLLIGTGQAKLVGKKLAATLRLVVGSAEEEPFVDKIWRRVKQNIQKGVSVGFRAGQVTRIVNAAGELDHYELGSKERPNELREISLVPMGSNPDAVAKSIAWERTHLEAEATKSIAAMAAENEGPEPMAMTAEEQKSLSDALAGRTVAEKALTDEQTKSKKLETDLTAEKAISAKLSTDLDAARAELKTVKDSNAKIVLDGLQGVKFAPAEREELDKLVADVGLDRVKSLIEKRSDIALTQPVTADGKPVAIVKTAPEPVTGSSDASGDLVAEATKGL